MQRFLIYVRRLVTAGGISLLMTGNVYLLAAESDFPPSETINAALQMKDSVESSRIAFTASTKELTDALDAAVSRVPENATKSNFSEETSALVLLKRVVSELEKDCENVLSKCEPYMHSGANYDDRLRKSVPVFRAAAEEFRKFAAAEPYADHRADYLIMAEIFELQAKRCKELPTQIAPQVRAVKELVPYLENGRRALARFYLGLNAVIESVGGKEFEELQVKLRAYAKSYESFRGSLRKFHSRLSPESSQPPDNDNVAIASRTIQHGLIAASSPAEPEPTLAIDPVPRLASRSLERIPIANAGPPKRIPIANAGPSEPTPIANADSQPGPRNILCYKLATTDVDYRMYETPVVKAGQSFPVRTDVGVVVLRVPGKSVPSSDGSMHFWFATLDRTLK